MPDATANNVDNCRGGCPVWRTRFSPAFKRRLEESHLMFRLFARQGLPGAIRSDNGPPFAIGFRTGREELCSLRYLLFSFWGQARRKQRKKELTANEHESILNEIHLLTII